MGRAGGKGGSKVHRAEQHGRPAEDTVMTASAAVREPAEAPAGLTLIERPEQPNDPDLFAQLVVGVVALVGSPVNPSLIAPAALVLRSEGLVDLPGVTFGCNYDLAVRSFELERGYVRAIDSGWLRLRLGEVRVHSRVVPSSVDGKAAARAAELFALPKEELQRAARHHLLRDADETGGRAA